MAKITRKCRWCPVLFFPNHRLKERQRSCGREDCKRKQKRFSQQNWQRRESADYRQAQRDWREKCPEYWKNYRKKHPAYAERNQAQTLLRKRLWKVGLQKRIDILEVTEKTMEYWKPVEFAKRPRSIFPILWAYAGAHEFTSCPTNQSP